MIYHLSLWRKYCFFVLSLWLVLPIIVGAEPHTEYQIEAFRTFESIEIDGQFNEPDWQNAKPIGQFVQVEPEEGAPMTLPTELRVLYDNQNIYFGFTCFDKEIDKLVANDMRRDARALTRNDTVFVLLDTYNDKQSGVFFRVNALGAMADSAVMDGGNTRNRDWDVVWSCGAKINENHWTAEFAIPFSQLRFNRSDKMNWGINVGREIRRSKEEGLWVPVSRAYGGRGKYRPG